MRFLSALPAALLALLLAALASAGAQGLEGDPETWWSLRPLQRPEVPELDSSWGRNELDAFVLRRLRQAELAPSPEAPAEVLLRRVTQDLIGLPPTPEERRAFLADTQPGAYERLVERLLASPHYGERQARRWLDVVHYADSHGYDKDKPRPNAWPYRDWVVDAFNRDLDWSSFIEQQLAGDLLAPFDPEGVAASGFVVAGPWDFVGHTELTDGTRAKRATRSLDRDDMLATTLGAFAGLTAACARCHDHKFDPVTREDYYALQAVFAGVERGDRVVEARPGLAEERARLAAQLDAWRTRNRAVGALRRGKAAPDQSPSNGWHSAIEARADVSHWVAVDLGEARHVERVILVPARPTDYPDTPGFGFPARYRVELANRPDFEDATVVLDATGEPFPNPGDEPVVLDLAHRARFVRVVATELWERRADWVFALAELEVSGRGNPWSVGAPVLASSSIEQGRWGRAHLTDSQSSREARHGLPQGASDAEVRRAHRVVQRGLREAEARLGKLPTPTTIYAPLPREPRPIQVLDRGDVDAPLGQASPGAVAGVPGPPAAFDLPPGAEEGQRRLALARWLGHRSNVLVWRTLANRLWQAHFGQGLVRTPSDLGRMGDLPSHPELLDWLAAELRDGRRSLKDAHRLIVTSATYRQASALRPEAQARDADNRLLWRAPLRRLDAEELRDALLAVTGELDRSLGGAPFQAFGFEDDHSPRYLYDAPERLDPATHRRSLYAMTVRSVRDPWLEAFDCPDPSVATAQRAETTTPQQALALFNDAFVLERAGVLAGQVDGAAALFERVLGRAPSPTELAAARPHAAEHGLASLARVLLNAAEFLYVD